MFALFSSSKTAKQADQTAACPRCAHFNFASARQCQTCGFDMRADASTPLLLRDDIALGFSVNCLADFVQRHQGVLHAMHVQVMQDAAVHYLTPSAIDTPNAGLKFDAPATVLLSRREGFALDFALDNLHTCEFLSIQAQVSLHLQIADLDVFAKKWMHAGNRLRVSELQGLLQPLLHQISKEFVHSYSLRELQDQPPLHAELGQQWRVGLVGEMEELGLVILRVDLQELRHDKLSTARENLGEKLGSIDLLMDERRHQVTNKKALDSLYSEQEWQLIAKEEEQVRVRYRREEMRQQFGKDLSWLYLHGEHENAKKRLSRAKLQQDESERLQAIRLRELELYARVAEASCRKDAIERGAKNTVQELEHTLKEKSELRQNEADQWLHIRTLARIKMRTESELTQMHSKEAVQLLQQRIAQQLERHQLEHEIAQNALMADQAQQAQQAQSLVERQRQLERREQELEDEAHRNRLIRESLDTEVRAREFQRMQAWESELHEQRLRALHRDDKLKDQHTELQIAELREKTQSIEIRGDNARALSQHEKLARTVELYAKYRQQEQSMEHQARMSEVEAEEVRAKIRQETDDKTWRQQHTVQLAEQHHQAELARIDIEKMRAVANFSETGKIATSNTENAQLLAEVLKLQTQASMSAEQILAMQAGQSAHAAQAMSDLHKTNQQGQGMSWEDTVRMLHQRVQDEIAQRQAEQERRHEIDLQIVKRSSGERHQSGAGQRK